MKVASKLIFVFKDPEGYGAAIYDALQSTPASSLHRLEESFELSLERYGIKDQKARGDIAHFVDQEGQLSVSVLLMQFYQPPILACAVSEVLSSIKEETLSRRVTLTLPFVLPSSKLKSLEKKALANEVSAVYGVHMGPATDFIHTVLSKAQELPLTSQIYYEPLACLLQFARALKFPTALLIGRIGQQQSGEILSEEYRVLHDVGGLLASAFSLDFLEDKIKFNPRELSKVAEEPWQALYR